MSGDAIEKTAAGATRGLLGSYSFILVMLGLEMWTAQHGTQFGLGLFLLILGGLLAYAAFFWETAKRVLSVEAQTAIGKFAQGRATWAFVLFLVFQAFLFAPFVEQHRWPFSYPADPETLSENGKMKSQLNTANSQLSAEKSLADRWRFAKLLRDSHSGTCAYRLSAAPKTQSAQSFWGELLSGGGWVLQPGYRVGGMFGPTVDPNPQTSAALIQPGITLRIKGEASPCATVLQRALTDLYPNPPSKIAANQQIDCDCVLIEMDY